MKKIDFKKMGILGSRGSFLFFPRFFPTSSRSLFCNFIKTSWLWFEPVSSNNGFRKGECQLSLVDVLSLCQGRVSPQWPLGAGACVWVIKEVLSSLNSREKFLYPAGEITYREPGRQRTAFPPDLNFPKTLCCLCEWPAGWRHCRAENSCKALKRCPPQSGCLGWQLSWHEVKERDWFSLVFEEEEREPRLAVWKECVPLPKSALST